MGFLSAYKHLEKLCGEVMGDERKISAYIDEMYSTPRGWKVVAGWDEDLRKLKQYRRIRNQIVHEPDCSEETMCVPEDEQWLETFYDRILTGTDPLTLYRKACEQQNVPVRRHDAQQIRSLQKGSPVGCAVFLLAGIAMARCLLI